MGNRRARWRFVGVKGRAFVENGRAAADMAGRFLKTAARPAIWRFVDVYGESPEFMARRRRKRKRQLTNSRTLQVTNCKFQYT
jgi:hypothetical protein